MVVRWVVSECCTLCLNLIHRYTDRRNSDLFAHWYKFLDRLSTYNGLADWKIVVAQSLRIRSCLSICNEPAFKSRIGVGPHYTSTRTITAWLLFYSELGRHASRLHDTTHITMLRYPLHRTAWVVVLWKRYPTPWGICAIWCRHLCLMSDVSRTFFGTTSHPPLDPKQGW